MTPKELRDLDLSQLIDVAKAELDSVHPYDKKIVRELIIQIQDLSHSLNHMTIECQKANQRFQAATSQSHPQFNDIFVLILKQYIKRNPDMCFTNHTGLVLRDTLKIIKEM